MWEVDSSREIPFFWFVGRVTLRFGRGLDVYMFPSISDEEEIILSGLLSSNHDV